MFGIRRVQNAIGRRALLWRSRRRTSRRWQGSPLVVLPGVMDPIATRVGSWLAEVIVAEVQPGEAWLDMGCGTGIVSLAIVASGARSTAVDVDPICVANAAENAALRGLDVETVESDHLRSLPTDRRWNAIVYNPPFWPGDPARSGFGRPPPGAADLGRAFHGGADFAVLRAFLAEATPRADRIYVALSEAAPEFERATEVLSGAEVVRRDRRGGECLVLYRLWCPGSPKATGAVMAEVGSACYPGTVVTEAPR